MQLEPLETARAWVEVDLGALERNARVIARRAGVPLLPMVKADAYGLGALAVVRALEAVDPWAYGVGTVDEGRVLRTAGVRRAILLFTPALPVEFSEIRALGLVPTLGERTSIAGWIQGGGGRWHLAIDTGMSRAGARWDRVSELADLLRACPPEGAFTHFHAAVASDGSVDEQEQRFREALDALPARPRQIHAENSPAMERRAPSPWTLARPGVFLYGVGGGAGAAVRPEAVAHLRARIVEIRELKSGDTVSYGATWRAAGPRRVATVSAGYADGIRRSLSNRGVALVRGQRAPIAGIVTMDMTMLDVSEVPCEIGDVATFLGRDGVESLSIDEVARTAEVSPYEFLVGLRLRAPRVYV
ncbi:MAG TPA: alanine racemase [Gemmatimonadaceae bacterium]|nr:alanine racemase [Gemmatimonadaceae bacterium]